MLIEDINKHKDPWEYIEKKAIEMTAKNIGVKESMVRLALEQSKRKIALGYALKDARQKRRISVKKMAQFLKLAPDNVKNIESENIASFPLGLITAYLNTLGSVLTFSIENPEEK